MNGSLVIDARMIRQHERPSGNAEKYSKKETPQSAYKLVAEAHNLMTLGGARVAKLDGQVGSIEDGMLADLALWSETSQATV